MEDLLGRGLSKWPQMKVMGKAVTVDQAKEIIRRTDTFFGPYGGGNDHVFDDRVRALLKMPDDTDVHKHYELRVAWRKAWGLIETEYVHNSWISCAFIGGPHGWCHPDGSISYSDNVGKYPELKEVLEDWQKLAKEFPFLELGVVLMNGEGCEEYIRPVVGFVVKDGLVTVVDPAETDPLKGMDPPKMNLEKAAMGVAFMPPSVREHGISQAWLDEWAARAPIVGAAP